MPHDPVSVTRRSANASLIGVPGARRKLSTPALVLDRPALLRNLDTMAAWARRHEVALRPHAKTHKSTRIAALQIERGALGVCCATIGEAEAMVRAGVAGVLITSPLTTEAKLRRLAALKPHARDLAVVIESQANLALLERICGPAPGSPLGLVVDLNIGHGRAGIAGVEEALGLAARAHQTPGFVWQGVQAYAGHLQHLEGDEARRSTSSQALVHLARIVEALRAAGLPPARVTGAGTGTAWADADLRLFTELQVGSYAVMDLEYGDLRWPQGGCPYEYALFVAAAVTSIQQPDGVIVDAGHKAFATDGPLPRLADRADRPAVAGLGYRRRGDEHLQIQTTAAALGVSEGHLLEFVVPHCDPTINLHDFYCVVEGEELVDVWPVDARGHG